MSLVAVQWRACPDGGVYFVKCSDEGSFSCVCESMNLKEQKMIRSISWTSSIMVALLAVASFSLSFEALRQLAVEQAVVTPGLSWVFPLVIDGAIVVFSMSALRASLREEPTLWLRGLVVFVSSGSVLFNICHVEGRWLAMLLAASPPVLLFLSFEALMHSVKNEMKRSWNPEIGSTTSLSKDERVKFVSEMLENGLNAHEIAEAIPSVSLRTIQRDVANIEKSEHKKSPWGLFWELEYRCVTRQFSDGRKVSIIDFNDFSELFSDTCFF